MTREWTTGSMQGPRGGVALNAFMLARERLLIEFVKQVCEISRGKA